MLRSWLINTLAVLALAYLLPGIYVESFLTAAVVALVLGVLNAVVRPILVILTIPVTILTLGLFLLVINVIIVELADYFVDGFRVSGFLWALIFSFGLSLISGIFSNKADIPR